MMTRCPGAANMTTPTLTIKTCPECGEEVELFSVDVSRNCNKCGFKVFNEIESCIQWCKYAIECVGEELYNKLMKKHEESL